MGCIVSAVLLTERGGRSFDRPPSIPYYDLAESRWHYRLLAPLSAPGDRLAIWGWAAHDWIYTKLMPATRESSTEFALKDWGPDGYYRKRYLASLRADPPEFFIEAVGPRQFFVFSSRTEAGMQVVPEVRDFVARGYRELLDDGDTAVWIRADRYEACCSIASTVWRDDAGGEAPASPEPPIAAMATMRWSDIPASGATLTQSLPRLRAGSRVVVPFVLGDVAQHGSIRFGGSTDSTDCAATPAPESALNVCMFDVPADGDWTLHAAGPMSVGQPLLLAAIPQREAR